MAHKKSSYTEDDIQVHKGLEGVRKRPALYLGERGDMMVLRMVKELVDNSVDEALAGRNDHVEIIADVKNNTYIVADKAEGIPVGIHKKTGISTLTTVFTELHAGGKFNNKAYKSSSGVHGVGASVVQALSTSFEVWTFREGRCYYQAFSKGKATTSLKKDVKLSKEVLSKLSYRPKRGTIIKFQPDFSIVAEGKKDPVLKADATKTWIEYLSFLNKGLTINFNDGKKVHSYLNTEGPIKFLNLILKEKTSEPEGKPILYEDQTLTLGLQWSSYSEEDGVLSFVSNSPTRDGGKHVDGMFTALYKSLSKHAGSRSKFTLSDLRNGLVGFINYRMSEPEFSSQTKDRLTSKVDKEVEEQCLDIFNKFFSKHKSQAKHIIRRANDIKKIKEEFKKQKQNIAKTRSKTKMLLPGKLATAAHAKPHERELFICEGDSAAGQAKFARNSKYQEVIPMSGKIANAMKLPLSKLLNSEAVRDLLIAIGYNFDDKGTPYDTIRIGKILLLSDSDKDGFHCNLLELCLLYKLLPNLFDEGKVFICDAPLYSAYVKGKRYFGKTFDDCYKQCPKNTPKQLVMRAKGWGEISVDMLSVVAMDPATRSVIKVTPVKGKELEYFKQLVGTDSKPRKKLLGL